ncbi:MAG TPA: Ig-like domain-containing protein [Pseudobacteroides sp.]|uniref:Ig-like domain-containing protein n=1 Tax=Pseudobacteroides sp. TaxID=1968840 RepID=UPI002F921C50
MRLNRIYQIIVLFCIVTSFVSCSEQAGNSAKIKTTPILAAPENTASDNDFEQLESRILNAKKIDDEKSWIESTMPSDNATGVAYSSSISIRFKYDIDEKSLNQNTIIIEEGKHSSRISDLFNFNYIKETRTLIIDFKIKGNGYGTSNSIMVLLSKDIKNIDGEKMRIDIKFGFMTK